MSALVGLSQNVRSAHVTETALDTYDPGVEIVNDGAPEQLHARVLAQAAACSGSLSPA